jgi:hypothetical protein
VGLTTFADLVFAAGVVAAATALALAALRRGSTSVLKGIVALEGVAAVGMWVAFALRHDRSLAVAAGGLTVCLVAATAALLLAEALRQSAEIDERLAEAEAHLLAVVEQERATRASELELSLVVSAGSPRSGAPSQSSRSAR